MEDEYLCWVNLIGETAEGLYTYEFLFSSNPDEVFGDDFENKPMGLCHDLKPYEESYNVVKTLKTNLQLDLVQNNCCFGFTDCVDGIIAICWENIDGYEEYPDYRLILHYAETFDEVQKKLAEKQLLFEEE